MPHSTRPNSEKYEKILEALRTLLETKKISQISVSEIAQTAGIGKGSIYYYFSSKEAIFDALMAKVITAINKMNKIRQIGIICWKILSHI